MPFWSDAVRARAAAGVFRAVALVEFDFADTAEADKLYWAGGFGPLKAADGRIYQGVGALATIEGLSSVIGTNAPQVTFTMSGVDARTVARAKSQSNLIKGRDFTVYLQCFGDTFADLLDFVVLETGVMDRMTYHGAVGVYTVKLTGESVWTGRSKPPYGEYSHADQQARFPGDLGLSEVAALANKTFYYP